MDAFTFDETTYDFEPYVVVTSKDACKKDGFKDVRKADGSTFKNQGECVSYSNKVKTTSYTLNSNSETGLNIPTTEGDKYKVTISGTWANRAGETVDAECTQFGTDAEWQNAVSGGDYSSDLLDVFVNDEAVEWGACAEDNTYAKWITADDSTINLAVNDSFYADNIGTFTVKVTEHPKN